MSLNPMRETKVTAVDGMEGFTPDMVRTDDLKWATQSLRELFKAHGVEFNPEKVLSFQEYTDDMDECVLWAIHSIRNDQAQEAREAAHGTGAC